MRRSVPCDRPDCQWRETEPGHFTIDCYCWRADENWERWRAAERADVGSESGDIIVAAEILNAP